MRPLSSNFFISLLAAMAWSAGLTGVMGNPLIEITISPESRVKGTEGEATRELIQGEWREFEIAIHNTAGITSVLQIESANLIPALPARRDRDHWLRLELVPPGPLTGKLREVRKLRLWTDQRGVRSAVVNVNAGQGTQDLGFRSDLLLNFKISPTSSALPKMERPIDVKP